MSNMEPEVDIAIRRGRRVHAATHVFGSVPSREGLPALVADLRAQLALKTPPLAVTEI